MAAGDVPAARAERMARAKERSVMICTPIARNPVWQYTSSILSTVLFLQEQGIRCTFNFVVGGSIIAKCRNELAARFLASDFTDLLFIDDDMEWAPNSVLRLLGSDKALIGGAGRMRVQKPNSDPAVWCWRHLPTATGEVEQDDMGAIKVRGFGAAFMLINRSVFNKLIEAHPERKRPGAADWPDEVRANYHEFFAQGDDNGETGEDYVFCDRWRAVGGDVWVDPEIVLGHVGSWNFKGSVSEILQTIGPFQ